MKRLPQILLAFAVLTLSSGCTMMNAYAEAEAATTPTPTPVPTEETIAAENRAACKDFEFAASDLMDSVHDASWTPLGIGDLSAVEDDVDELEEIALGAPAGDVRDDMVTTVVELPLVELMGNITRVGHADATAFMQNVNQVGMSCKIEGYKWSLEFSVK